MAFDLSNYEPVEKRIDRFYMEYKNGRIVTELVAHSDQMFIVKAFAYRDAADERPASTGFAEERVGSNPVNRQSALENCETSAIGRCLANLNFAPKGARPSLEEMTKSDRVPDVPAPATEPYSWSGVKITNGPASRADASDKQIGYLKKLLKDIAEEMQVDIKHATELAWQEMGCDQVTGIPNKASASLLINDLTQGQASNSMFREKLRGTTGEKPDPWNSPNF
jgi:hypothetical protein